MFAADCTRWEFGESIFTRNLLKPLTGNEFSGWRLFLFLQAKEYSQPIDYADVQNKKELSFQPLSVRVSVYSSDIMLAGRI